MKLLTYTTLRLPSWVIQNILKNLDERNKEALKIFSNNNELEKSVKGVKKEVALMKKDIKIIKKELQENNKYLRKIYE